MILTIFNSRIPAAMVGHSPFDDEKVLIPLTPAAQQFFNRRAVSNRKLINKGKK